MSTAELLSLFEARLAQAMMLQRTFRGDNVQTHPPAPPSTNLVPGSAVQVTGGMAPLFNNGRVIQPGDADQKQAQWRALMGEGVGYPGDAQHGSAGSFHCLLGRDDVGVRGDPHDYAMQNTGYHAQITFAAGAQSGVAEHEHAGLLEAQASRGFSPGSLASRGGDIQRGLASGAGRNPSQRARLGPDLAAAAAAPFVGMASRAHSLADPVSFLPAGSNALGPDETPPPAFLVPLPGFTRGPPRARHVTEEAGASARPLADTKMSRVEVVELVRCEPAARSAVVGVSQKVGTKAMPAPGYLPPVDAAAEATEAHKGWQPQRAAYAARNRQAFGEGGHALERPRSPLPGGGDEVAEALQLPEDHFDRAAATSHSSGRSSGTGAGSPAGGEGASSSGGTTAATAPSSGGAAHRGAGASKGRRLSCTFVFVGFDPEGHQDFELVPRLIGRGGTNMRDIAKVCEGKVRIRGRGSGHLEQHSGCAGAKEADVTLQIALSSKDRINFETGRQRLVDLLDFVTVHFERYCRKKGIVPTPLLYTVGTGSD